MGMFDGLEAEVDISSNLIPEGTKIDVEIMGVRTVEEELVKFDNPVYRHIVITVVVTEKGKHEGKTFNTKCQIFHPKLADRRKGLERLLSLDANSKGEIAQADKDGKDIFDKNFLNRALNGTKLNVDVIEYHMPTNEGNRFEKFRPQAGTKVAQEDEFVEQQAQTQQPTAAHIPVEQQKSPPISKYEDFDDDIPF